MQRNKETNIGISGVTITLTIEELIVLMNHKEHVTKESTKLFKKEGYTDDEIAGAYTTRLCNFIDYVTDGIVLGKKETTEELFSSLAERDDAKHIS